MSEDFERVAGRFDLLGDPIPDGFGKRGRPEHIVSDEKRQIVVGLRIAKKSNAQIALALNCSEPTLRKHYFRELMSTEEARLRIDALIFSSLVKGVESGNAAMVDKLMKWLDRIDRFQAAPVTKPAALGKKDSERAAAKVFPKDSSWGSIMGAPSKVVLN